MIGDVNKRLISKIFNIFNIDNTNNTYLTEIHNKIEYSSHKFTFYSPHICIITLFRNKRSMLDEMTYLAKCFKNCDIFGIRKPTVARNEKNYVGFHNSKNMEKFIKHI